MLKVRFRRRIDKMFSLMKKDKEKKKKEDKKKCSSDDLDRLEEARRSYFGRKKKPKDKGASPDLSNSGSRNDSLTCETSPSSNSKERNNDSLAALSDSSENSSLSSVTRTRSPIEDDGKKPPVPPRLPKRGILKGKAADEDGVKKNLDDEHLLARNTLRNELIVYENLQEARLSPNRTSPTKSVGDNGPSPLSLSKASTPLSPFNLDDCIGDGSYAKTFDFELRLPSLTPPKPPKARNLTILRQAKGDFGFSLRRAAILERGMGGEDPLSQKRTVIFAEPGSVGRKNETGLLPGDRLLEVNGVSVEDKSREEVVELIKY